MFFGTDQQVIPHQGSNSILVLTISREKSHIITQQYHEMSLCSFIESCRIYPSVRNTPSRKEGSKTSLSSNKHTGLEIFHLVHLKAPQPNTHITNQPMPSHAPTSP